MDKQLSKSISIERKLLQGLTTALGSIVWVSALLFGLFILSFYFVALLKGNQEQWNQVLPDLYETGTPTATVSIGIHFAFGGIILVLGCIQLLPVIRQKYLKLHRWLGRIYVFASLATALGGLVFIFLKGTIGGLIMDIGFTGYGILMFWAAVETIRHAWAGRIDKHRAWGIRLFALAIGSWLYRMDYGFWFLFAGKWGHTDMFTGPFDYFMDFWFYLPNLVVAEIFIRKKALIQSRALIWFSNLALFLTCAFLVLATYYFTKLLWGNAILDLFWS